MRTEEDEENYERLSLALDQLAADSALSRSSWYTTAAALRSLEKLLSRIALGKSPETTNFGDICFPDEENEFFAWYLIAQDNFQYNLSSHLLAFLRRIVNHLDPAQHEDESSQCNELISTTLHLLQGALLLHSPSRSLFSRRPNMSFLLKLFRGHHTEAIHMDVIQTTVAALVDRPDNLRMFEDSGGLKRVSQLFLDTRTGHKVKVKVLEFLYFYLIPEITPAASDAFKLQEEDLEEDAFHQSEPSSASTVVVKQHIREPAEDHITASTNRERPLRKTTEEKQILLGKYFSNIDALVKDLNEFKPFGEF